MAHIWQHERVNWIEAQKIHAQHRRQIENLRAQRNLSDEGRRNRMGRVQQATRDKLAALDADDLQRTAERAGNREQGVYAPTDRSAAGMMNARDATSRAAEITTVAQAQQKMQEARRNGDSVLAAAVARRAEDLATADPVQAQNYRNEVVVPWASTIPGALDALDEVADYKREQSDVMSRMRRSQQYNPSVVPEIQGMDIDALAARADADDTGAA